MPGQLSGSWAPDKLRRWGQVGCHGGTGPSPSGPEPSIARRHPGAAGSSCLAGTVWGPTLNHSRCLGWWPLQGALGGLVSRYQGAWDGPGSPVLLPARRLEAGPSFPPPPTATSWEPQLSPTPWLTLCPSSGGNSELVWGCASDAQGLRTAEGCAEGRRSPRS